MALNGTMVKIETVTVGSGGAANITFSNIPQTYTDLKIVASLREAGGSLTVDLRFNGDTGNNYSWRRIQGAGSGTPNSSSGSSVSSINIAVLSGLGDTASTFGSLEYYIPNYTASTNKSVSGDSVTENNATTAYQRLGAGLWSSSSAITSVALTNSSGQNFDQYSTATLYGISRTTAQIKATGGMVYDTDTHVYHLFNTSGTFTPTQNLTVDYLVVAGGGGGGAGVGNLANGGGGGAGGLRSTVTATGGGGSLESALALTANTNYTVTVGAGGANDTSGSNSVFSTITSTGGGRGGNNDAGRTGGSGGGGGCSGTQGAGGAGTANQGFAGSAGVTADGVTGGGGGGAGEAGGTDGNGYGGDGVSVSITGTSVTYAGGGSGGINKNTRTPAGDGGGGEGGFNNSSNGLAGTANLGGGGGGGQNFGIGGAGGSGVVIVRYAK